MVQCVTDKYYMKLTYKQLTLNSILCLTLLMVIMWALYAEYDRPWKKYQKEFSQYKITLIDNEGLRDHKPEIQQVLLRELGEVDRCTTCHQGADNTGLVEAPQPFTTHSGDYVANHPTDQFGCVVCHEGQGPALTVEAAHGEEDNWTKPILKKNYAQASCGRCHFMDRNLSASAELIGASVLIEGQQLFKEYNCIGCHDLNGHERHERIAPSLSLVGNKVNKAWLIKWLQNPNEYFPATRMPRFDLSNEEISYISDYLLNLRSPGDRAGMARHAPADITEVEDGQVLVNDLGCMGCHKINNEGNNFAPPFSDIGSKVNSEWLYQFIKAPKSYDPKTIIPDFVIADKDISSMAAYLMSLRNSDNVNSKSIRTLTSAEGIEKGKNLVKTLGCAGCHEIANLQQKVNAPELNGIGEKRVDELVFNNVVDTEKTLINWLKIKVAESGRFAADKIVTRMPNYNFTSKQSEAITTFLLSIKDKPVPHKYKKVLYDRDHQEMKGKKVLAKYNCLGCHIINKTGGGIGPDLTREGSKGRPEWLFAFLKSPHKIRPEPVLKARMPDFNLPDTEIYTIVEYMNFLSGEPYPYNVEPRKIIYPEDIRNGEKLYQDIFACNACHTVNSRGGDIGPDHTDLASRLNREWLKQWLENPQSIKPDVIMPRFTFEDWEFEALTVYLMTLGKYRFVREMVED